MTKIFEDHLSEIQADMVSIALEYIDHRADEIFIYAANENGTSAFDVFYKINGTITRKEEVNNALRKEEAKYEATEERQDAMLNIGLNSIEDLEEKCNEFGQETPSEMLLHYTAKNNKLRAKLRYGNIFSEDEDLLPGKIFESWFQSVSNGSPAL